MDQSDHKSRPQRIPYRFATPGFSRGHSYGDIARTMMLRLPILPSVSAIPSHRHVGVQDPNLFTGSSGGGTYQCVDTNELLVRESAENRGIDLGYVWQTWKNMMPIPICVRLQHPLRKQSVQDTISNLIEFILLLLCNSGCLRALVCR